MLEGAGDLNNPAAKEARAVPPPDRLPDKAAQGHGQMPVYGVCGLKLSSDFATSIATLGI